MGLISRVSSRTYRFSFYPPRFLKPKKTCLDLDPALDPLANDPVTIRDRHHHDENDPGREKRVPTKSCTQWLSLTCQAMYESLNSSENSRNTAKLATFSCQKTDTPAKTEASLSCDFATSATKRTAWRASNETRSTSVAPTAG